MTQTSDGFTEKDVKELYEIMHGDNLELKRTTVFVNMLKGGLPKLRIVDLACLYNVAELHAATLIAKEKDEDNVQ